MVKGPNSLLLPSCVGWWGRKLAAKSFSNAQFSLKTKELDSFYEPLSYNSYPVTLKWGPGALNPLPLLAQQGSSRQRWHPQRGPRPRGRSSREAAPHRPVKLSRRAESNARFMRPWGERARDSSCIFHGLKCINSVQCINCDRILKQNRERRAGWSGGRSDERMREIYSSQQGLMKVTPECIKKQPKQHGLSPG